MIVAESADRYRFVTQPDHADLAGQFAEAWGNGPFDRPGPHGSVVAAAYAHDTGWQAYDRYPRLDGEGTPVDFREMPADAWTDLYEEGIDAVARMDPYAGLLVSMHGAGLRKRRYGLSPEWPETPPGFEAFLDREETRQRRLFDRVREAGGPVSEADGRLLTALHEDGRPPEDTGSRLWTNYRLLQAWDSLSLAFCVTESPPAYPGVDGVPTGDGEATLSLTALGDGAFGVQPYPFEDSPLGVCVSARTVERDAFDGEDDLARAYYGAGRETLRFELREATET